MNYLVLEHPGFEGRYEFDLEANPLNTREWGWLKRLTERVPETMPGGLSDPEVHTAFAMIALVRAGKVPTEQWRQVYEQLSEVPYVEGLITEEVFGELEEDDAGPPQSSSSENGGSSGADSTESSETSVLPPRASGTHGWDTSEFAPPRSGS